MRRRERERREGSKERQRGRVVVGEWEEGKDKRESHSHYTQNVVPLKFCRALLWKEDNRSKCKIVGITPLSE